MNGHKKVSDCELNLEYVDIDAAEKHNVVDIYIFIFAHFISWSQCYIISTRGKDTS